MNGRRRDTVKEVWEGEPGDYTVNSDRDAVWVKLPTGSLGRLPVTDGPSHDDPPTWTLVEHDDRTITLSPSIRQHEVPGHAEEWHGFLERGVWRTA